MRGHIEARTWSWCESLSIPAAHVAGGGVLVVPTESSYGLAVDPCDADAVAKVFEIKGRPAGKPLPVVGASLQQLSTLGLDMSAPVLAVARRLWPAALTAVVPIRAPIPASAGHATLAVRVPAHSALRHLLIEVGSPLTATSANATGDSPVTTPDSLVEWLRTREVRANVLVIDDGPLPGGSPSTLIDWVEPRMTDASTNPANGLRILRPGAVPVSSLVQGVDNSA